MNSCFEAMLVLEHHRALYRFNNARTEEDRVRFELEAKKAEKNLMDFERRVNDRQVQGDEKANPARKVSTDMWTVRQANNQSK